MTLAIGAGEYCDLAGVDRWFRRTAAAARNMIRAGVSQAVTMSITDHKTQAMFMLRYNITSEGAEGAAIDAADVEQQPKSVT